MSKPTAVMYGIPNCDTVKKARAWLDEAGVAYGFHDFKKAGVPDDAFARWVRVVDWETLVNRRGRAWRGLDDATQASVRDDNTARAVLQRHVSVVKRPVIEWPDGGVTVGFDAAVYATRAKA